ncbi:MAG: hypothetical protein ABI949_08655 [Ilumatobacteraceae bacterium]
MKQEPRSEWEADPDSPEVMVFERLARSAGASLRSDAPEQGITTVIRQGNRQRNRRLATEIAAVTALLLSGIALFTHFESPRRNVDLPPNETPQTPTSVSSVVPVLSKEDPKVAQWFWDYTGNPAGPTSGDPVKFGVMMPSYTYGADLTNAAKYMNEHAGGAGGRPVSIDVCAQTVAECAERFATDPDIVAVLENQWGGESLGTALAGRKPLHTTYSGGGTTGVGYYPTYRETVTAMALQAARLTAPGGHVIVIDAALDQKDLANGTAASDGQTPSVAFALPDVASALATRHVTRVRALETESLVDTIRNANGADAAAIVLALPPISSYQVYPDGRLACDDLFNALAELRIRPAVISSGCEPHAGWYEVDAGYNLTSPALQSGAISITTETPGLGDVKGSPQIRQVREVGALLAVIRIINQLGGPSQATPAALDRAMREFTGPLPVGAGPVDCAPTGKVADRVQPGSCVRFVDVHRFVGGKWIDVASIDLGA